MTRPNKSWDTPALTFDSIEPGQQSHVLVRPMTDRDAVCETTAQKVFSSMSSMSSAALRAKYRAEAGNAFLASLDAKIETKLEEHREETGRCMQELRVELDAELEEMRRSRQEWTEELERTSEERRRENVEIRASIAEVRESLAQLKTGCGISYRPRGPEDDAWLREEKPPLYPFKNIRHDAVATRTGGGGCGGSMQLALGGCELRGEAAREEKWLKAMNKKGTRLDTVSSQVNT